MSREYGRSTLEEFGSADITYAPDHVDPLNPAPEAEIGLNDDAVFQQDKGRDFNAYDFFEDPEPGEVPVMKEDLVLVAVEDMQYIASLESQAKHLNSLLVRINQEGGMSKSIAMEARELMADFDKGTHIGYYTEHPSKTRLNVATEGISTKMWAVIAAAAAAIAAMIYKLYKWLTGKDKPTQQDVISAAQTRVEVVKQASLALGDVEHTTHEVEQEIHKVGARVILQDETKHEAKKEVIFTTFDQIVEDMMEDPAFSFAKEVLHGSNHFINDLLDHGPYVQAYIEVGGILDVMIDDLEAKLANSMRVINKIIKDRSIATEYTQKNILKELDRELTYRVGGRQRNIRDMVTYMSEARAKTHSAYSSRHLPYTQLLSKTRQLLENHQVQDAMNTEVSAYRHLDSIRKHSDTLADFLGDAQDQHAPPTSMEDPRVNIGPDTGPMLIKAVLALRAEVSAYEMVLQSCHQFELQLESTYRTCFAIGKKVMGKLSRTIVKNGGEVPQHLRKTLNFLAYMNDSFGRVYMLHNPEHWRDQRYMNISWDEMRNAMDKQKQEIRRKL